MTSRPSPVPVRPLRNRADDHLYRALAATFLCGKGGQTLDEVLRAWPDDRATPLLLRAATSPAATTSSTWAGSLAGSAVAAAIVGLAPISAAAALIGRGLVVSLDGVASITVPTVLTVAADAGSWIAEGAPFRVRQVSVNAGPTLTPCKLGCIRVFNNELAKYAVQDVEAIMRQTMGQAAALALDSNLFGNAAASAGLNPAGLLNGVSAITATTGGGVAAMSKDIEAMIAALAAAGAGVDPVFIAAPGQAAAIKLMAGPKFDYPVFASAALAAGNIIAIEAPSFVSGFSAVPQFSTSTETLLHMEDTGPAQIGTAGTPNVVAAPARSLYQVDATAVKMTLRCAWGMRATGHVQYITATTW
jgi:hypothetical protein